MTTIASSFKSHVLEVFNSIVQRICGVESLNQIQHAKLTWRLLCILSLVMGAAILHGQSLPQHEAGYHFREGRLLTWISFFLLCGVGYLSNQIWLMRRLSEKLLRAEQQSIWRYLSIGFYFLACDELFKIHEEVDRYLHYFLGFKISNISDHLDDVIVIIYGIVGMVLLYQYRKELLRFWRCWPYFALAALLAATSAFLDLASSAKWFFAQYFTDTYTLLNLLNWLGVTEEVFKIYAEVLFVGAFACCLYLARSAPLSSSRETSL